MMKTIFIDTETTGLNPKDTQKIKGGQIVDVKANGIIQIGAIVEIDGVEVDAINIKMCPPDSKVIEDKALEINKTTREMLATYDDYPTAHKKFVEFLEKYVDKYDETDKFVIAGQNTEFDINFLEQFFDDVGDKYFYSYFTRYPIIDCKEIYKLASYLGKVEPLARASLVKMAEQLKLSAEGAHDALFDITLTRNIVHKLIEKIKT